MVLSVGIKGYSETYVTEQNTAGSVGSGDLKVFATPAMITLMEEASWKSVSDYIGEGEATCGTELNIRHISATPVGAKVTCESMLTEIDGKKLVFSVTCQDALGVIGEGTHVRYIVNRQKFEDKAASKFDK